MCLSEEYFPLDYLNKVNDGNSPYATSGRICVTLVTTNYQGTEVYKSNPKNILSVHCLAQSQEFNIKFPTNDTYLSSDY